MPSRVIRGEIVDSVSLSRMSMEAELTFDRLILAVDDYGRFDARPEKLKAALFPMRKAVTPAKVMGWVEDLSKGDDPPVMLYEVDGRPYLVLTGWEKHRGKGRRGQTSKYPEMLIPGIPRKSEECHADPPGGRGTRDEKREAGDESFLGESRPAPNPKLDWPEVIPPDWADDIERYMLKNGVPPKFARQKAWFALNQASLSEKSTTDRKTRVGWLKFTKRGILDGYFLKNWAQENERIQRLDAINARHASSETPTPIKRTEEMNF